jgi:hypothetical protein
VGRDEAIPADFLDHLRRYVRPLANEQMRVQMNVARMLWFGSYRNREHVKYDGFLSYTHNELDGWFGRRKFKAINERLGLFDITHWSWEGKFTKGYRMTAETALTLERYFKRRREDVTAMLFGDGSELKTTPPAIASKDARGRTTTAWPEAAGLRLVPVNIDQMKVLREWLKRELKDGEGRLGLFTGSLHRARLERLLDDVRHLIRLAQTKPAGRGYVAHRYVQASSGRLYAKGWNLQNAGSIVKQAALAGMWEYDFANCHYSILMQMAAQFDCQCEAIQHYLDNKRMVRESIAFDAQIGIDQAKVCLLAIMYGARQTLWPTNAIPSEIGTEAAERLFGVDLFAGIHADIQRARRAIVKAWPRDRQGRVTNLFGRSIGGKQAPEEILAHLIQGVEASALQGILTLYPQEIVLVQHDGFAAEQRLDCGAIEQAAATATGYGFKVEEKRITLELDNYFHTRRIQNDFGRKPKQDAPSSLSLAN